MLALESFYQAGYSQSGDVYSLTCHISSLTSPNRKGKGMSFFHLKDSYGMTQLVVNRSLSSPPLSQIPVESVVLIEGLVVLRPPKARKPVSYNHSKK
jgi:aspartyl-tRNA synthetase